MHTKSGQSKGQGKTEVPPKPAQTAHHPPNHNHERTGRENETKFQGFNPEGKKTFQFTIDSPQPMHPRQQCDEQRQPTQIPGALQSKRKKKGLGCCFSRKFN